MAKNQKLLLTIELVPASAWGNNLRSVLKPYMWKKIRQDVLNQYNNMCTICKTRGRLHAHEVWEYNDKTHIQTLNSIIALCRNCHAVKHFGHTELESSKGNIDKERIITHFMKINNCDRTTFQNHYKKVIRKFNERSKFEWQLAVSDTPNRSH